MVDVVWGGGEGQMATTDADGSGDEQNERTQINLVVSSEQKDDWTGHADDEPEYSSLSDLVRQSVSREIAGGHDSGGGDSVDDEAREMLHELIDGHRKIMARIDDVDDRLGAVESVMSEPPEDVKELMGDVFEALPTEDELAPAGEGVLNDDEPTVMNPPVDTGRVEDVADHLNEKSYEVRRAIEQLQEDSSLVQQTEDERYYRRA
jgi:hypothetical protein